MNVKSSACTGLGWSKDPGPPSGGEFPRHYFLGGDPMAEKTLSIFIDESGDFGKYEKHASRYIIGLVFHDQRVDISENINNFQTHLKALGHDHHAVHTGPIIRREEEYRYALVEDRKRLFNSLFNCIRKMPIQYAHIIVNKKEWQDPIALNTRLSRDLGILIDTNFDFFRSFDTIIIYYDNGQTELTKLISSVFGSHLPSIEFRKVVPADYLLFQIADYICSMELLADKADQKEFSRSELEFFNNIREFKKNYMKWIRKKHI